jgi:hypothetical protein
VRTLLGVHFCGGKFTTKMLSQNEPRQIAADIAKLLVLLRMRD